MMQRLVLKISGAFTVVIMLSLLLTGCGSSRSSVVTRHAGGKPASIPQKVNIPSTLAPQSRSLMTELTGWLGTPYKYGGDSRDGVDCSGLMLRVYNDALNIKLPRNSRAQSDYCTPVDRNNLTPGDLIFFATTRGSSQISHVGMYIGDGKMVHSSTSSGVIVSDLDADYYKRTFAGAGRVESYHAMINPSGKKNKSEKGKPGDSRSVKSGGEPVLDNEVTDYPPFKLEPVVTLPVSNESTSNNSSNQVMMTPAAVTSNITPEISSELARLKVLDDIIEQKIDSIVAN